MPSLLPSGFGSGLPSVPSVPSVPGVPSLPYGDPGGMISGLVNQSPFSMNDPTVMSALSSVQQAAVSEGWDPTSSEMKSRVSMLLTAGQQIYQSQSFYGAADTALNAARQLVGQNKEVAGALSTIDGLLTTFQLAQKGNPAAAIPSLVSAFSGPIIAAVVATTPMTMGVGALITAAIAIGAELIESSGLLAPKPGLQICSTFNYTGGGNPSFSINCMVVFDSTGGPISPGSKNWRSFPNPKIAADAWWFAPMTNPEGTYTTWKNAKWIPEPAERGTLEFVLRNMGIAVPLDYYMTPVNAGFGQWWLVCANCTNSNYAQAITQPRDPTPLFDKMSKSGLLPSPLSNEQKTALLAFDGGFSKAWEANQEFSLNGLKSAPDAAVFQHYAELWNRAHTQGEGVWVAPWAYTPGHELDAVYWAQLISQGAINQGDTTILDASGKKLFLHTGPKQTAKTPPPVVKVALTQGQAATNMRLMPVAVALPKITSTTAKPAISSALGLVAATGVAVGGFFLVRHWLPVLKKKFAAHAPAAAPAAASPEPSPPTV